jgi:hypothetical protein
VIIIFTDIWVGDPESLENIDLLTFPVFMAVSAMIVLSWVLVV